MLSSQRRGPMRALTPLSVILCAALLASCAGTSKPLTINVPPILREPCARADVGPLATVGDLGALALRQEAALSVCNARREAVVAIVDAHRQAVDPRPWWKLWK
jgi:hypothetical protein